MAVDIPLDEAKFEDLSLIHIDRIEDLKGKVGEDVYCSDWVEITQAEVDMFANATGDRQWIHTNPERAKRESRFGGTVAHGYLVLSLIPRLSNESLSIGDKRVGINCGLEKVRFLHPVVVPSRIRSLGRLLDYREVEGGAQLTWQVTLMVEGRDTPACVAHTVTRALQ